MSHAARFCAPPGPYLLSHSIGLQPIAVRDTALARAFDVWANAPADAWPTWLAEIDAFRAALAQLFGARLESFCPQQNLTSGWTKILGALPERTGRTKIVLTEDAFPSLGFAIDRSRFEPLFIGRDVDVTDADAWRSSLTEDVAIVLITHAHSNTGELVPVQRIVEIADESDIRSVVDVAQSAGVIPIDITEWNACFVLGSCVKWLCGGPGAGFLWANPGIVAQCSPTDTGWFSHADPFEFDIHHFVDAPDALRFWGGTPSVLPSVVARSSIELMLDIGISEIRRHNLELGDRLIDALPAEWVVSPTDASRRNGTVVVDPGERIDAVVERLADASIAVDRRSNGLRISPHIYNTAADIDALLAHLLT